MARRKELLEQYAQDRARKGENGEAEPEKSSVETETEAVQKQLAEITAESLSFTMNPNVFLPHPEFTNYEEGGPSPFIQCDVDPEMAAKDEALARELSQYLYTQALPTMTTEVRQGEWSPLGGEALVETIHGRGVNLRYLGRLAVLAAAEEADDAGMLAIGKQHVQAMPQFWLELLEVRIMILCLFWLSPV